MTGILIVLAAAAIASILGFNLFVALTGAGTEAMVAVGVAGMFVITALVLALDRFLDETYWARTAKKIRKAHGVDVPVAAFESLAGNPDTPATFTDDNRSYRLVQRPARSRDVWC